MDMPRPRPPHVHREETRHGKTVWYVRIGKGPRIRMPAGPGQPGFDAAYQAALLGEAIGKQQKPSDKAGTVAWLIERYRDSSQWRGLSQATRKQREAIFRQITDQHATKHHAAITRAAIVASVDRRRETPHQARNFLDALKGLFRWALEAGLAETDPTVGVKPPKRKAGEGFPAWTPADVAKFEARWPLGTRPRLAFDVLRYTGLRRGDAVALSRFHMVGGVIRINTEKTNTRITIPILPPLAASIEAGPVGETTLIARNDGKPVVKESFGTMFRDWCDAAGVSKSAHGIRKYAAAVMAEHGATVEELKAVFGWTNDQMPSLYTKSASREAMAARAAHKLMGEDREQPNPAPLRQVRELGKKD